MTNENNFFWRSFAEILTWALGTRRYEVVTVSGVIHGMLTQKRLGDLELTKILLRRSAQNIMYVTSLPLLARGSIFVKTL